MDIFLSWSFCVVPTRYLTHISRSVNFWVSNKCNTTLKSNCNYLSIYVVHFSLYLVVFPYGTYKCLTRGYQRCPLETVKITKNIHKCSSISVSRCLKNKLSKFQANPTNITIEPTNYLTDF
jgi:hypothetical protein